MTLRRLEGTVVLGGLRGGCVVWTFLDGFARKDERFEVEVVWKLD